MARLGYIASVGDSMALGTSFPPGTDQYALFPGHSLTTTTQDGVAFTDFPLRMPFTFWLEIRWRIFSMQVNLNYVFASGSIAGVGSLRYQVGPFEPTNEVDLCHALISPWIGGYVQSLSPLQSASFTVTLMGGTALDYYWRTDTSPQSMIPLFRIDGDMNLDFGTEISMTSGTGNPPSVPGPNYFEQDITFFGTTISMWFDPSEPALSVSVDISGLQWWEYRQEDNTNPIWDSATGAQLLTNWPIYQGNQPI